MIKIKKICFGLFIFGSLFTAYADVCTFLPGNVSCGKGKVDDLVGNGSVFINGTEVIGPTVINGLLNASDASFTSLEVNGTAYLMQCTVKNSAHVKGTLTAISSKFEGSLEVYSNEIRLTNSKVSKDLNVRHSDSARQIVYLDHFSEIGGNIIFDDGKGEVVIRGKSKIGGKVIGGHVFFNDYLKTSFSR